MHAHKAWRLIHRGKERSGVMPGLRQGVAFVLLGTGLTLAACKSVPPADANKVALQESRDMIHLAVTDPEREKSMLELVGQLEADLEAYTIKREEYNQALALANADFSTTREQMQDLYDALNRDNRDMLEKLTITHFALRELATREEWAIITANKHRIGGM